jgi:hypothetical protein
VFALHDRLGPGDIACHGDLVLIFKGVAQPVTGVLFVVDDEDNFFQAGLFPSATFFLSRRKPQGNPQVAQPTRFGLP